MSCPFEWPSEKRPLFHFEAARKARRIRRSDHCPTPVEEMEIINMDIPEMTVVAISFKEMFALSHLK